MLNRLLRLGLLLGVMGMGMLLSSGKVMAQLCCTEACNDGLGCCGDFYECGFPPDPPPPGDPWTCFPAGTKVTLPGDVKVNIEDVKVGDKVVSQDETGNRSISTVTKLDQPIREHMCQIDFENGEHLQLTNEHPLMTQDGWKSISPDKTKEENPNLITQSLMVGDNIVREDGVESIVKDFSCWSKKTPAYNLILDEGAHTYFADGYLAHNKGCWLGATDCPVGSVRTDNLLYKECISGTGACIGTAQTQATTLCNGTHNKNRYTWSCCATEPLTTKPTLLYPADGGKVSGLTSELTWEGLTEAQWGTSCDGLSKTYEVHVKAGDAGTWAVLGTVDSTTTSLFHTGIYNVTYYWYVTARKGETTSSYAINSDIHSFVYARQQIEGGVYYDPSGASCSKATPMNVSGMTVSVPATCRATMVALAGKTLSVVDLNSTWTAGDRGAVPGAAKAAYPPSKYLYPLAAKFFSDSDGINYYISYEYKSGFGNTPSYADLRPLDNPVKILTHKLVGGFKTYTTSYFNSRDKEITVNHPYDEGMTTVTEETVDCLNAMHLEDATVPVGSDGKFYVNNIGESLSIPVYDASNNLVQPARTISAYTVTLSVPSGYQCKLGCGECPVKSGVPGPTTNVNFYLTKLNDFTPWWQVSGAGVYAGGEVKSGLPSASDRLILSSGTGSAGALLLATTNTPNLGLGKVSDEGWIAKSKYKGKTMGYDYFAAHMGVVKGQASDWQSDTITMPSYDAGKEFLYIKPTSNQATIGEKWTVANGEKYTVFVNGDLRVSADIVVADGGFLSLIVSGKVVVDPGVEQLQGLIVVGKNFVTEAKYDKDNDIVDSPLEVQGTVVAWGEMQLFRNLGIGNSVPAEKFVYRRDLLANMPEKMKVFAMQWQEVVAGSF